MKAVILFCALFTNLLGAWQTNPFNIDPFLKGAAADPTLIIIGENHTSLAQRRWVKDQLGTCVARGYTTLYLELYPADTKNNETIRRKLSQSNKPDVVAAYMAIIIEAQRLGMKIVPFDHDIPWPWAPNVKPSRAEFYNLYVVTRNKYIVKNLIRAKQRGVVLIGRNHLGIHDDPRKVQLISQLGAHGGYDLQKELAARNTTSTVISLCGGSETDGERHIFDLMAEKQGKDELWGVAAAAPLPGDYVIKLPNAAIQPNRS